MKSLVTQAKAKVFGFVLSAGNWTRLISSPLVCLQVYQKEIKTIIKQHCLTTGAVLVSVDDPGLPVSLSNKIGI